MKNTILKNTANISGIIRDALALRLNEAEAGRLLVLLKILNINLKKAESIIFWRRFYQNNPSIFDFIIERS